MASRLTHPVRSITPPAVAKARAAELHRRLQNPAAMWRLADLIYGQEHAREVQA